MRKYFSILLLAFSCSAHAQKIYTAKEINRLADLGKIWGILHNFHPDMARGIAATDSLVIDAAATLANNPSKENFEACLRGMLARVKDPLTHIVNDKIADSVKLFTTNDSLPSFKLLTDSILYVAFPTNFAFNEVVKKMDWLQPLSLGSYKGVILDLRNKTGGNYNGDNAFMQYTGDLIIRSMIREPLSNIIPLYRYQFGFLDQASQSPFNNIYSAGWQTNMTDVMKPAAGFENWKSKVVFVINRFTTDQLLQYLLALQSADYCKIIFDGDNKNYNNGMAIDYYTDADSIHLKLRVADYIGLNNNYIGEPDLFINNISDKTEFLEICSKLINKGITEKKINKVKTPTQYTHPYPTIYNSGFVTVGLRLFGLYNYWNAINYFAPNKYLIRQSWDSVLYNFIPKFINANDSISYYLTIRDLASQIHDSHGFFGNEPAIKALSENYNYKNPFSVEYIENKYIIVHISKDSLQDLSRFKLWDEIVAINDTPINIYKEKFRTRFATSNESTFERDLCSNYLLSGAHDSKIQFTIMRNEKLLKVDAKRTALSFQPNYELIDFNDDHKDIELLANNIGYVNMGSLTNDRVEKMFDTLMNTKAIIFDIRNYPRGTAWAMVPRLTDHDSIAVKFDKPFVTFESIYTMPAISNRNEFFTVYADKTKPFYKGKIIMLCNAQTQSQAEYTIMMFQGAAGKRVTVIGSTTAGADGNVTAITLPGGYSTYFSGLGVLYPDGAQTQQKGIRIDIISKPTVAGLKANKDEVLERAIQFANTGK